MPAAVLESLDQKKLALEQASHRGLRCAKIVGMYEAAHMLPDQRVGGQPQDRLLSGIGAQESAIRSENADQMSGDLKDLGIFALSR